MAHGQKNNDEVINSKQLFTFSTFSNEYEIMSGLLDDDEMVVKAQDAKIKLMTNENGIFKLEVKKCGEMFDYDMQIKAKTDAKMAKMLRFFEYGAKYLVFSPLVPSKREKNIPYARHHRPLSI